jgi:WD40 repeat protein
MADNKKPETKPAAKPATKPAEKPAAKAQPKPAEKPAAKVPPKPTGPFVVKTLNDSPKPDPKAPTPPKGPTPVQLCGARFSPCGKFIVAGGMMGQVLRWDASNDEFPALAPLAGHGGFVEGVTFGAGGKLYTGDSWGRLRAWNYADAAPKPLWDVAQAHDGWLRDIAVSPDGKLLATCGRDKIVRLWNAADGKKLHEFSGHVEDTFRVAFSPDGKLLASGDLFGNVKLWDVAAKKHLRDVDAKVLSKLDRLQDVGGVRLLLFTPDGKRLLVGGTQPKNGGNVQGLATLIEYDPATGKQTALVDFGASYIYVTDLRYLPDGTRAVTLSGNPGTGRLLVEKPGDKTPIYENTKLSNVHAVSIHPTLKRLAVTGMNANTQGNGRGKSMGDMDYPGNYSPVHVIEFPPVEKTA